MNTKDYRLTEEEIKIHYLGSRLSAVRDLLDAQIASDKVRIKADLFSKVSTPEGLREEVAQIYYKFNEPLALKLSWEYIKENRPTIEERMKCLRFADETITLFQLYASRVVEQARKEEREKFYKWLKPYIPNFSLNNRMYLRGIPVKEIEALEEGE